MTVAMRKLHIHLNDVRIFARHGVFDFERERGNDFIVNLEVGFPAPPVGRLKDRIDNTICYDALYKIIKMEMEVPRALLETVAIAIGDHILNDYPWVTSIDIGVTKLNPPIRDFCGSASVSFHWSRD